MLHQLAHVKGQGNFLNGENNKGTIRIIWDDQKPNKVEVQAIVYYTDINGNCDNFESGSATFTHILRSVLQETIPNVSSSVDIPYCNTNPVINLSAGPMYIKNTGNIGQPPLTEVDLYDWELPAGWQTTDTQENGSFFTTVHAIEIEPIDPNTCAPSGVVKVRAIAGGDNSCNGAAVSVSRISNISLNRIPPGFIITAQAGFNGNITCGDTSPVTFTATDPGCSANYNWSYPSGWSQQSKSGNTITLVPDGNSGISGTISAEVVLACGTVSSSNYNVNLIVPSIGPVSGPSIVCTSSSTFSLNDDVPATAVSWSVSPSNYVVASNGTGKTANIAAREPHIKGNADITFSISVPGCPTRTKSKRFWVGKPMAPPEIGPDHNGVCREEIIQLWVGGTDGEDTDAYTYNWTFFDNQPTITYESFNSNALELYYCDYGQADVSVSATNSCGTGLAKTTSFEVNPCAGGGTLANCNGSGGGSGGDDGGGDGSGDDPDPLPEDPGCGGFICLNSMEGSMNVYPVPVKDELTLEFDFPQETITSLSMNNQNPFRFEVELIPLYDTNARPIKLRLSKAKQVFDTHMLKSGMYALILRGKGESHQRIVVIK
ncbi:MAG: hypothetical protein ABJH05_01215 [Fulvivirga sp.]